MELAIINGTYRDSTTKVASVAGEIDSHYIRMICLLPDKFIICNTVTSKTIGLFENVYLKVLKILLVD